MNVEANHQAQSNQPFSIPGYRFIRTLGDDSNVFLAERSSDFLKVVIRKFDIDPKKDKKYLDSFRRNIEAYQSLKGPGVATIYDVIECSEEFPPCLYVVQEYIEGRTLSELIEEGQSFSLKTVIDIVLQILTILKQLHTHQPPIMHLDIKPSNILLSQKMNGEYLVYLINFDSISRLEDDSTVSGTFGYMPPEQMMAHPVPGSDIYALATTIVELLSGVYPGDMPVKNFRLQFEPYLPGMDNNVVEVLQQMLDPDINKRLCDIDKLFDIFDGFSRSNILYNTHIKELAQNVTSYEHSYMDYGDVEYQNFKKKLAGVCFLVLIILTILVLLVKNFG